MAVIDWNKQDWELIYGQLHRIKVFGGWLVSHFQNVTHIYSDKSKDYTFGRVIEDGFDWRESMTFVPDPNHEWVIEKK